MLQTHLTTQWGLKYPIVNASMTPAAGGRLARAVCEAGGLGMIGVNEHWDAADIARHCGIVRDRQANRRFGIGFFGWAIEQKPELLTAAIAERPFFISISFIDVAPYAKAIHEHGIILGAQVQSRDDVSSALAAGVDVLIAQGTEAGGHTGDISSLVMLQIALSLSNVPVIAAGGIGSGAAIAATIAAGAEGVWIGTPFLVAHESDVSTKAQDCILGAEEDETVLTALYDRLYGLPWPSRFRGRALQNAFTKRWHGREEEALTDPRVRAELTSAKADLDFTVANIYAGQSVGLIDRRRSAGDIVRELGDSAERQLRSRFAQLF